jgi:hypothetical protein
LDTSTPLVTVFQNAVSQSLYSEFKGLLWVHGIYTASIAVNTGLLGQTHCGIMMDSMVSITSFLCTAAEANYDTGLIRYGIVIHCFIDGHSRFVTGIGAHNNNRGSTVLVLFHGARQRHGDPSRVRGDHGVENIMVAQWMEDNKGSERGSYIWGK